MVSIIRWIRDAMSRITGFSTPLFGVSWNSPKVPEADSEAHADSRVLTPGECARVLRVDDQAVIGLLESGKLGGLSVADKWRVTTGQIAEFLHEQSRAKELEVLARRISDPKTWAAELRRQPVVMKGIQEADYPKDSFGRFLQDSLSSFERDGGEAPET